MGGVAAITTAGAIIIRAGMRITGVPGISRVNSAWNIDDWSLLGSSTHQARSRAPVGLPDILQPLLNAATNSRVATQGIPDRTRRCIAGNSDHRIVDSNKRAKTDCGARPVGDPASVKRFDSDSSPIGIIPNRTFARSRRFGRPCRVWRRVGLQRGRYGEWRAGEFGRPDRRPSHLAVRHHGAGHQQEQRPLYHRPHQ
jgi:hypothetical protein